MYMRTLDRYLTYTILQYNHRGKEKFATYSIMRRALYCIRMCVRILCTTSHFKHV